jgi:lipopolysaccharide/colanic/teichoic acid biosynthesis glycosyltransferase
VSNGQFVTRIDNRLLEEILGTAESDLVAVTAEPGLSGAQERIRLTTEGNVAGFRRVYSDSAELAFVPADWPHHLFIRAGVLPRVLVGGAMPVSFSALSLRCQSQGLKLRAVDVGGAVLDLETEEGMLGLCSLMLSSGGEVRVNTGDSPLISPRAKLVGNVLLGDNVEIGPEAVIVGPTIVAKDAKIERGAVISSSIIGEHVCVPERQFVRNCIAQGPDYDWGRTVQCRGGDSHRAQELDLWQTTQGVFRNWPRFSYARFFKRVADFVAALMVLILFAPVIPFIALAIKLTCPGPVFYSDKRQGLHGKEFGCLKFRTMVAGADKIQDKLRFVSAVDGPQFKMDDDPRISTVGRFLRETYIDEVPQFFNVLFGQMSIVGPRPSPESENTLCPPWRDARLSVRPGITGLWQLHRTREPMKDFQEWIHYDTMYVRNLSLKVDLITCWRTAMKLLDNFISQF